MLSSRFAAVRVREGHRYYWRTERPSEEWLLIEWPEEEPEPTKYWLSNLGAAVSLEELVAAAKLRWRIERDYQELKQEIGLGHFEGRGWRGFHHHATLCIAAYGFLVAERSSFPPPAPISGQALRYLKYPQVGSRGDPPPRRPERHSEYSIATIKRELMIILSNTLSRCPCCHRSNN